MTPPDRRSTDPPETGPLTNDEVDYLLSDGQLGSSQRDRILDAITGSLPKEPRRRPGRTRLWLGWAGLAAATAAAAVLVIGSRATLDRGHFQSKGGGPASPPSLGVECLRATLAACPRGALLVFSAGGAPESMFVTAYLDPSGAGPRTWLLSNEATATQAVGKSGPLPRGARVPEDQPPGAYRVRMIVTQRPLSHDEAIGERPEQLVAEARFDLRVVP